MNQKVKNFAKKWFWHSLSITAITLFCMVIVMGFLNAQNIKQGTLDLTEVWSGNRTVLRVTLFDMKDEQLEVMFNGNYSTHVFRVGDSLQIQRAWGNNTGELSWVKLTEEMFDRGAFHVPLDLFKKNLIYGAY